MYVPEKASGGGARSAGTGPPTPLAPGADLAGAVAEALSHPGTLPRTFLVTGPHGTDLRGPLLDLGRRFPERGSPSPIVDLGILAGAPEAFLVAAAAGKPRPLVLVDASGGDVATVRWLRRAWLPRLPAGAVTVVAVREVEDAWIADPGWRALSRVVQAGGPLSLAAAPTPTHRAALIVAAMSPRITEDLLAAVVDRSAGPRLFEWLARLPGFVQAEVGLAPGREVRHQLQAELTRAPEAPRLRLRLVAFHRQRIRRAQPRDRGLWAEGLLHLRLSRHPVFTDPGDLVSRRLQVSPLRPADGPGYLELIGATAGEGRRAVARWWLEHRPGAAHLCRERGGGAILGLMILGELDASVAEDDALGPDPGLSAALWALRHRVRLGPREKALFLRGYLGAEPGPAPTAVDRVLLAEVVSRWVADPRIRVLLASVRPGDAWTLAVALGAGSAPLARYRIDGTERLVVALHRDPRAAGTRTEPVAHLPWETFHRAVDAALRHPDPASLATSPLLGCPSLLGAPLPEDEVATLVDILLAAMAVVEDAGTVPEAMAVLRRLWRDPELPQRILADTLGISSRSFRRRLAAASVAVAQVLWARSGSEG